MCTRQYRPPEAQSRARSRLHLGCTSAAPRPHCSKVTLGLGWSHAVDVWSMGCILAELWTGELLFRTHDEARDWPRLAEVGRGWPRGFPGSRSLVEHSR